MDINTDRVHQQSGPVESCEECQKNGLIEPMIAYLAQTADSVISEQRGNVGFLHIVLLHSNGLSHGVTCGLDNRNYLSFIGLKIRAFTIQ